MNNKILNTLSAFLGAAWITYFLSSGSLFAAEASAPLKAAAPSDTVADSQTTTNDPYEGFNRKVFTFNDTLDIYVLKPFAKFYNLIMPRPLNEGIHNVYLNIDTVPTIVNDLLQANFFQAANDLWRIGVNTTVGIGGLFDVASRIKLKPYVNDFGLTLTKWGYKNSNYLVLPFWGPRTVRDSVSIPIDYYFFSVYPYIEPPKVRYGVYALYVVDWRAQLLKHEDVMDAAAVDKYAFVRDAYLQNRAYQIEGIYHRSYDDLKDMDKPIATVDSNTIQTSADQPVLDNAE